jgi:peptidyl-prolyl cis-trans isomerase C
MNGRIGRVALGAAVLAWWVALAGAQPAEAGKVAAVVNGVQISVASVEARMQLIGTLPANAPEEQRRQRCMEALGMLIDEVLFHQFLEKNAPPVSPEEMAKHYNALETGLKEQGKSMAEFCHDTHRTLEQFRYEMAETLRWMAYTRAQVNDANLERYYKENKDVFDKVSVRASHIVLRVPAGASEKDKAQVRARLQEIRTKLASDPKADFAEMAKAYSQDPMASRGGDLGWFPRKWVFDETFSRAAFALQKGQVSDIVETEYGLHLIKVTDRKPGEKSDFAKIKEAVREFCIEDLRQRILGEQRKTAKIELIAVK